MTFLQTRSDEDGPMPWVWVVAAVLIGTICISALAAIGKPPGLEGDQVIIHKALLDAESEFGMTLDEPTPKDLTRVADELEKIEVSDPAAKGTLARAILILRQAANPGEQPKLSGLVNDFNKDIGDALTPDAEASEDILKVNKALRQAYTSLTLTDREAGQIAETLSSEGARWPMQYAVEHARTLTGEEKPTGNQDLAGMLIMGLIVVGIAALIWLFRNPKPLGIPAKGTAATGDNLGARFLIFALVFAVIGAAVTSSFANENYGLAVAEVVVVIVTLAIITLPLKRRVFSLKDIGIRFDQVGSDLRYGAIGYLANFPAAFLLIIFGSTFLSWIPSGGHPIESDLLAGNNIAILILSAGPLTAILEEIAFRGLLFQGLALRFRVWPAIVISSLGFAMIHPQGGMLWPSLAWVGGMAAYLTYRQSSLIPAIVMHALHNTTLIVLSRIATGN